MPYFKPRNFGTYAKILALCVGALLGLLTMQHSSKPKKHLVQQNGNVYRKDVLKGNNKGLEDVLPEVKLLNPVFKFSNRGGGRKVKADSKGVPKDDTGIDDNNVVKDGGDTDKDAQKQDANPPKSWEGNQNQEEEEDPETPVIDQVSNKGPITHPHPYRVIHSNTDHCKVLDLLLVVMVHSDPTAYRRRAIIRETWGNSLDYPNYNVRLIFVMGNVSSLSYLQKGIDHEFEMFRDILQASFEDTHKQRSVKTIAGLKWISKYCSHASYILKTDDTMFINMYTVLHHLQTIEKAGYNKHLLMGYKWKKMKVMRDGRFAVSRKDYPDDFYPNFCSSMAYFMSVDVAMALHNMSYYVWYPTVEDVYITGVLARALRINIVDMNFAYFVASYEIQELMANPYHWFKYAFAHIGDHDTDILISAWNAVSKVSKKYPIPVMPRVEPGKLGIVYLPKEELVKNPDAPYNQRKGRY